MTRRVRPNYFPSSLCSKSICRKPFGHIGHLGHHPRPHTLFFITERTWATPLWTTLPLIELEIRDKAQTILIDFPSRTESALASSGNSRTLPEQYLRNDFRGEGGGPGLSGAEGDLFKTENSPDLTHYFFRNGPN